MNLNEQIDLIVDEQLNKLVENKQTINEGLVSKFISFSEFGLEKVKDIEKLINNYQKCINNCVKENDCKTYSEKSDIYIQFASKNIPGEKQMKESKKMDDKIIKNNPGMAKCMIKCRYNLMGAIITLLKKNSEKICKKTESEDKCNEWVKDNLDDLDLELEYLQSAVKSLDKLNTEDDAKKVSRMIDKVNQNLMSMRD